MKPEILAENDERYVMGQWFESVAAAVKAYPMRAGARTASVIEYDQATVSLLAKAFNSASRSREIPSALDQAGASRHVYTIAKTTKWDKSDVNGIHGSAQEFRQGVEEVKGSSFAARFMLERMKRLYKICKLNRIGVSVTASEDGRLQIDLVPQERPVSKPVLRGPKQTFGR